MKSLNVIRDTLRKIDHDELVASTDHMLSTQAKIAIDQQQYLTLAIASALLDFAFLHIDELKDKVPTHDFRLSKILSAKGDENFSYEEYMLINCIDFAYGPFVSIVLIMFLMGDLNEEDTLDALNEAYWFDNIYRESGIDVTCFKFKTKLVPFEVDAHTLITAMWFQEFMVDFDCASPSPELKKFLDDHGYSYWGYYRNQLEEKRHLYSRSLSLAKIAFPKKLAEHSARLSRHSVIEKSKEMKKSHLTLVK